MNWGGPLTRQDQLQVPDIIRPGQSMGHIEMSPFTDFRDLSWTQALDSRMNTLMSAGKRSPPQESLSPD